MSTEDCCGLFWRRDPGTPIYKLEHLPLKVLNNLSNRWLCLGFEGDYDCAIFSNNSDGISALRRLLPHKDVSIMSSVEFVKTITDLENVGSD